jgi:hypothetical protein
LRRRLKRSVRALTIALLLFSGCGSKKASGSLVSLYSVLPDTPEARDRVQLVEIRQLSSLTQTASVEKVVMDAIGVDWSQTRLDEAGLAPNGFHTAAHFGTSVVFGSVTSLVCRIPRSSFS